jgi:hypothetical protein
LDLCLILEIPVVALVFGNTINSNLAVIFRRNNRCGDRLFIPVGQAAVVHISVIIVVVKGVILRVDRDSDRITTTPIITEQTLIHVHRGLAFNDFTVAPLAKRQFVQSKGAFSTGQWCGLSCGP